MSIITRRNALKLGAAAGSYALLGGKVFAQQTWPSRPVHVIMGFGAGGGADSMARPIFQGVSEIVGQPMVIENRTGGNSVIAAQAVLQMEADGHALFLNGLQQIVNPLLMESLPFSYEESFVPITQMCSYPQTFAVSVDSPWQTMEELLDHARANPGQVRYGTSGIGGIPHFLGEQLQLTADVELVNVPYTSGPDIAADVAGGRLDMSILTTSTLAPMHQAGRVRVLAIGNETRSALHPDVPTLGELGFEEANFADWTGLFAPAGTPEEMIGQIQAAVAEAAADPDVVARLETQGTIPVASTPEEFAEFLEQQRTMVARVIEEAGISLQ